MLSKEAYEAGQKAQVSPLDLMECLQDRPVEPSKAVQGKCVAQAEKQEPVAWVGCGDCDCEFPCYHGKTTCLRLPTEKDEPVGYMHPVAKKAISLADLNGQSEWIRAEWIKGAPLYTRPQPETKNAGYWHKCHEIAESTNVALRKQIQDLTAEVERLKAERDSFYMDYRMKCDLETKQQAERIAALEAAAREARDALQYKLHVVEAILTLDAVLGNAEITGG